MQLGRILSKVNSESVVHFVKSANRVIRQGCMYKACYLTGVPVDVVILKNKVVRQGIEAGVPAFENLIFSKLQPFIKNTNISKFIEQVRNGL